jgi:segregation and condensation protein A
MSVEIKLQVFEGPLDLLLHLIAKAKVSIEDIFVSEITEQFIEYVQQMQQMDMEIASEFITMAATLLRIKSRSLLPNTKPDEEDMLEERDILEQLREFARIRAVLDLLSGMESQARSHFYKLREEFTFQNDPIDMTDVDVQSLYRAFLELMETHKDLLSEERINVVRRDPISVHSRIEMILNRLRQSGRVKFFELFSKDSSKEEIIATFLALLEVITAGKATVIQQERFAEIEIAAIQGGDGVAEIA